MSFENIIGNNKTKETLTNIIKSNTVMHSYMFIGPNGIRKNSICKRVCKNDTMSRHKKQTMW